MPCERCGELHLGKGAICRSCRQCKRRRIHAFLYNLEEEESLRSAKRPVPTMSESTPGEDRMEVLDEEDGLVYQTSFSLLESQFDFSSPPPRPLSQSAQGSELSNQKVGPVQSCNSGKKEEMEENEKEDWVPLRVFYWNVERFGGLAQWGLLE